MARGSDYTVERKDEVRRLGKGGDVETWFRVWATSKGGTYFHTDIPEAELGKADERLTAKAKQLDSI